LMLLSKFPPFSDNSQIKLKYLQRKEVFLRFSCVLM
jgi:hypothetical protein